MNKKQKIVLGLMVVGLSCVVVFPKWSGIQWPLFIPVILIGGFLLFILKSEKKDK